MLIQVSTARKTATEGKSKGSSTGGSQSTSHENFELQAITNMEAFSSAESWGDATAVDSSHAADMWFTYKVKNTGTEYARQICDLVFNVYIGDDPNPVYTYFVGPDIGGDGCYNNFQPGEEHVYSARTGTHAIPLSLSQMKAVDLGGPVRIVPEDYTFGATDEGFFNDALAGGVTIAIEDGRDDGDETIDKYLIPTWGEETILNVLERYFPCFLMRMGTRLPSGHRSTARIHPPGAWNPPGWVIPCGASTHSPLSTGGTST